MPDGPDAASGYVDGVKWLVGLSGGAVAGVFAQYEQVTQQPLWVRAIIGIGVFLFLISIWAGVNYLLWINAVRRARERIEEITTELAALNTGTPDTARVAQLKQNRDESNAKLTKAARQLPRWHKIYTISFDIGVLLAIVVLFVAIARPTPKQPEPESAQRFVVTQSAIHKTPSGRQAHTFLLDQKTGSLWQMVCDQKGEVVAFRRVRKLDTNGNPEPVPSN